MHHSASEEESKKTIVNEPEAKNTDKNTVYEKDRSDQVFSMVISSNYSLIFTQIFQILSTCISITVLSVLTHIKSFLRSLSRLDSFHKQLSNMWCA